MTQDQEGLASLRENLASFIVSLAKEAVSSNDDDWKSLVRFVEFAVIIKLNNPEDIMAVAKAIEEARTLLVQKAEAWNNGLLGFLEEKHKEMLERARREQE
jgi:hypothetical protein